MTFCNHKQLILYIWAWPSSKTALKQQNWSNAILRFKVTSLENAAGLYRTPFWLLISVSLSHRPPVIIHGFVCFLSAASPLFISWCFLFYFAKILLSRSLLLVLPLPCHTWFLLLIALTCSFCSQSLCPMVFLCSFPDHRMLLPCCSLTVFISPSFVPLLFLSVDKFSCSTWLYLILPTPLTSKCEFLCPLNVMQQLGLTLCSSVELLLCAAAQSRNP